MIDATPLTTVHPSELTAGIQRWLVDATDVPLIVDTGNTLGWLGSGLVFSAPGRFRVSLIQGSLGHAAAAVVALAQFPPHRAAAALGDGSMLYTNEVSTAAAGRVNALWIVLNDGQYGSCVDGQMARGLSSAGLEFPRVDFAGYARSLGAEGVTVHSKQELDLELPRALRHEGPFVLDVWVERVPSPLARRHACFYCGNSDRAGSK